MRGGISVTLPYLAIASNRLVGIDVDREQVSYGSVLKITEPGHNLTAAAANDQSKWDRRSDAPHVIRAGLPGRREGYLGGFPAATALSFATLNGSSSVSRRG